MGSVRTMSRQHRMSRLRHGAIGLGAVASFIPLHVDAQAPPAPSSALEDIIVTARRVEENLQDTPLAVSVFSGDALTERQVFETTELDQVVPNLQFANNAPLAGNNASSQVFIRGIGQTDPTSTVDPGVGLYIDEVYMGRSVGGVMDFRDIASVQVLRGPQGTLFGRNTIGGAVLLTTALPGDEFGGTVKVGIGDDNLREGFVAVDLPMTDTLAARFSAGARQRDGYVTRVFDGMDLGDEDSYTLQSSLRWQASEGEAPNVEGGELTDADYETTVTMNFKPLDDGRTLVEIAEEGWRFNQGALRASYGNCQGWSQMLCALKVWLEHGINLREGMYV